MVKAEPLHGAGAEVIGDDVTILGKLEKNFFAPRVGHFQTEALLIAGAEVGQVAPFVPPLLAGPPAGERPGLAVLEVGQAFHADDLSTQVGQERSPPRKGVHLFQGENAYTLKNTIFRHRTLPLSGRPSRGRPVEISSQPISWI